MIAAQRRALILDLVRRSGATSIAELADGIGASLSTIRRDLDHLTREGYLVRSHGGAVLAGADGIQLVVLGGSVRPGSLPPRRRSQPIAARPSARRRGATRHRLAGARPSSAAT